MGRDRLAHPDEEPLHAEDLLELFVAGAEEGLVFELVDPVVEVGEYREEAVDEPVDDPVEEVAGVVDRPLALHVALTYLGEGGRFVAVDRDEELLRVEAVHLDETVVVGNCAVDDEEDVVVVVVDLGALSELLGVLDGERVELEDVAEDLVVVCASGWSMSSQKKESPARSFSTFSRLRCISSLPRSWMTVHMFGAVRVCSEADPSGACSPVVPAAVVGC